MDAEQKRRDEAFMREARIGLTVVSILVVTFVCVMVMRIGGWMQEEPVAFAPVAHSRDLAKSNPPGQVTSPAADPSVVPENQRLTAPAAEQNPVVPPASDSGFSHNPFAEARTAPRRHQPTEPIQRLSQSTAASFPGRQGGQANPSGLTIDPGGRSFEATGPVNPRGVDQVDSRQVSATESPTLPSIQMPPMPAPGDPALKSKMAEETGDGNPSSDQVEVVITKPGVGYWEIAQNQYGDGRFFSALYQYNRHRVAAFDPIPPDSRIEVPAKQVLILRWPELCPEEYVSKIHANDGPAEFVYVTKPGESLFDVARDQLGQASRFIEIFEHNRHVLPVDIDHMTPLKAGTRLRLPR